MFLVTVDVVSLYPSIPHNAGLKALYKNLEERLYRKVLPTDLVDMAEYSRTIFLKFNSKVKQQISGTGIGTKFAPPYPCIFMDKVEIDFLEIQTVKPLVWLRYNAYIFFILNESEEKL